MFTSPPDGTPRLTFESLCAEHASELFGALCDPRVYEHLGERPPQNVADLAARYAFIAAGPQAAWARERWINFALRLRISGALIGRVEATIVDGRAEVAYLLAPDHGGQGYATEAMTAFQEHLWQNEHIAEFWATTSPHNAQSIALLRRLGYRQVFEAWPALLSYETGDLVFTLRQTVFIPATDARTDAGPDQ